MVGKAGECVHAGEKAVLTLRANELTACFGGRADGEVVNLLREGLEGASRTRHIEAIQGEFNAIDTALARLSNGDLCLILIDQVEEALAYINEKVRKA